MHIGFVARARQQRAPRRALPPLRLWRAAFCDPAVEFVAVEEIIGTVDQGCGGTVLEFQKSNAIALGGPGGMVEFRIAFCDGCGFFA